jgi:hypothetical protein
MNIDINIFFPGIINNGYVPLVIKSTEGSMFYKWISIIPFILEGSPKLLSTRHDIVSFNEFCVFSFFAENSSHFFFRCNLKSETKIYIFMNQSFVIPCAGICVIEHRVRVKRIRGR